MKTHPFLLFIVLLLLLPMPLLAAQAPKLETLLGEYKKARADVLGKLNESYAGQADALVKQYHAIANLDGADRAQTFARRLRDPSENNEMPGVSANDTSTDPLAILQSNYVHARAENLNNVYVFYSTTAANLRGELLQSKDQAGADVMTAFLEKIKPAGTKNTAAASPAKTHKKSSK